MDFELLTGREASHLTCEGKGPDLDAMFHTATEVRIKSMAAGQAVCEESSSTSTLSQSTVGRKLLREIRDRQVWNMECLNSSRLG